MEARLHPAPTEDLSAWLRNLPKPAAIMAAYDFLAKDIIDACQRTKIEIPNQVCILGVDDDELVCDYTQPLLSSIRIDHVDVGYNTVKTLESLIKRKQKHLRRLHIRHSPDRIVERESTRPIPPTTHLVNKLQDFIKAHAKEPITVADVVRHAHVSRRLADMRLKQCSGKTIHQLLQETRLKLVKNYLTKTQMPINKISRLCGFQNIQRLKYIFKTEYGISMREWRQNHSS
jgi:LacI family transcriptional regulator